MLEFAARFILGGGLVASLPLVSERLGPAAAGALLLFPAVSLAGLLAIGLAQGVGAVGDTSFSAVAALPAVLAFLLGVHYGAKSGLPLAAVLAAGTVSWLIVAIPISIVRRERWSR